MAPKPPDFLEGDRCRYCKRRLKGFLEKRDHNCQQMRASLQAAVESEAAKETRARQKKQKIVDVVRNAVDTRQSQPCDQDLNHEQSQLKAYPLQEIDDACAALGRMSDAPVTADYMIRKLLKGPKRYNIRFRIAKKRNGELRLYFGTNESVAEFENAVTRRLKKMFPLDFLVGAISDEDAKILATEGFQPLLERFVTPPQASRGQGWLMNAARRMCLQKNSSFRLVYSPPTISQDPAGTHPKFAAVTIRGQEFTAKSRSWAFSFQVRQGTVLPDVPISIPFAERIDWTGGGSLKGKFKNIPTGQTVEEYQKSLWPDYEDSREYLLAKKLTVMFDGYIGNRDDADMQVRSVKARYTGKKVQQLKLLNISRGTAGEFVIKPSVWIATQLRGSVDPITITTDHNQVLLEILTSMLEVEDAGGNLEAQFDAGARAADAQCFFQDDDPHFCPRDVPVCEDTSDTKHSHICHSCLEGRQCEDFTKRSTAGMLCFTCLARNRSAGWAMKAIQSAAGIKRPELASFPSTNSRFIRNIRFHMIEEFGKYDLNKDLDSMSQEIGATTAAATSAFQESQPMKWHDYIINQVNDENGPTYVNWMGSRINPFFPSVDAVRPFFFLNNRSRYHAFGNIASTSWTVNSMKGLNSALVIKAAFQQLTATNMDEYLNGVILAHRCLIFRHELDWNTRYRRVGMEGETDYWKDMAHAIYSGDLPRERHVPFEKFSKTENGALLPARSAYKMPRYDEYFKPAMEQVAARHGFDKEHRELWLRPEKLCHNEEVFWTFSNTLSLVKSWTHYQCTNYFALRRFITRNTCNNHSTPLYKDDPNAKRVPNLERYMLMVLHIHLNHLRKAKNKAPQWVGEPLRIVDIGGLEYVPNHKTPWSLSVAHATHGEHMHPGWTEEDDDYPNSQGEESFDFNKLNCDLQSWMTNTGLYTADVTDTDRVDAVFDQLRAVRVEESDFVPTGPRPFKAGLFKYDHEQHLQDLQAVVRPDNENFTMRVYRPAPNKLPGAAERQIRPPGSSSAKTGTRRKNKSKVRSLHESNNQLHDGPSHEQPPALPTSDGLGAPRFDGNTPLPPRIAPYANLGRGLATCYVSSAVQVLYHNNTLREIIRNCELVTPQDRYLQKIDRGNVKHAKFVLSLKVLMTHMVLDSPSTVDAKYVQAFRRACNDLTTSGDWLDTDSDSGEFLSWILTKLNIATDVSGVKDRVRNNMLTDVTADSSKILRDGLEQPILQQDIEKYDEARKFSGHYSVIDPAHTVHIVEQLKCEHDECGAIKTEHQYTPIIELGFVPETKDNEIVPFEDLRGLSLTQGSRSVLCPRCEQLDRAGSQPVLWDPVHRIVNDPEVLIFKIDRLLDGGLTLARVEWRDEIDLRDWRPKLHSDPDDYEPASCKYRLQSIIFYQGFPRHYFPYIRETSGDQEWVQYDDQKARPIYCNAEEEERSTSCESVFVYVRADKFPHKPVGASSGLFLSDDAPGTAFPGSRRLSFDSESIAHPSSGAIYASDGTLASDLLFGSDPPGQGISDRDTTLIESEDSRIAGHDDGDYHMEEPEELTSVSGPQAPPAPAAALRPMPSTASILLPRVVQDIPIYARSARTTPPILLGGQRSQPLIDTMKLLKVDTMDELKNEVTRMKNLLDLPVNMMFKKLLKASDYNSGIMRRAAIVLADRADFLEAGGEDPPIQVEARGSSPPPAAPIGAALAVVPPLRPSIAGTEAIAGGSPRKRARDDDDDEADEHQEQRSPRKIAKIKLPFVVSDDSTPEYDLPPPGTPASPEERESMRKERLDAERRIGLRKDVSPSKKPRRKSPPDDDPEGSV